MSVLVIGAGHAGGALAGFLRQFGYANKVVLVGSESVPPYQRPPLSKAWLKGEADANSLMLRPEDWYAENDIELHLEDPAVAIDLDASQVRLRSGAELEFEHLVIATGARARRLGVPGEDQQNVLALRDVVDAERLKDVLALGRRLVVIGAGYVGLEAAASARTLGAEAVVIEREPRVLARVASEELSQFFHARHAARGVAFEFASEVKAFEGADGLVSSVRLSDGRSIPCDAVLVGVGALPNTELAEAAGIRCDNGVLVDGQGRTSHPSVFAIGDVTRRPLPHYDRMHRLESVPNALEQAKQVASHLSERAQPVPEVPWFWSDQYDLKLQIAGLPFDCDRKIVRGDPAGDRFSVFHLHQQSVRAVEAVNSPPEFMVGKQLIASAKPVDPERLADPLVLLKSLLTD